MPLAAGEDKRRAADVDRQDRAHRFVDADEGPVQTLRRRRGGNDVGPVQVAATGKQSGVADRNVGGNDDLQSPDCAPRGLDDARRTIAQRRDARVLEDVAPASLDGAGEALKVLHRVKLRLVIEPDPAPDSERQRHLGGEDRRKAQPCCQFGFVADAGEGVVGFRVGVVGHPAEIAVDAFLRHHPRDVFDRGLVGLPVGARDIRAVPVRELGVGQAVQRGDLAGGVPCDSGADARGLEDGDGVPGPFEGQRRGQAGDPCSDHRHVGIQIRVQGRIAGGTGCGNPERHLLSCESFTHGAAFRGACSCRPAISPVGSEALGCFQAAGTNGIREGLVVLVVLVGVTLGEVCDR